MTRHEAFEKNYDPTDADRAMQVGYAVLQLVETVEWALKHDRNNMLLGRDCSTELAVRMRRLLKLIEAEAGT